jgi:hypothetical protein
MKTHNANIYHCISCGRIEHVESEVEPPLCCGNKMAKACAETVREGDTAGEKPRGHSEAAPPLIKDRKKPR